MWSKMIQRLLNEENLLIGISELSEIAEVSPRQLRYWEEKGIFLPLRKTQTVHGNIGYIQSSKCIGSSVFR